MDSIGFATDSKSSGLRFEALQFDFEDAILDDVFFFFIGVDVGDGAMELNLFLAPHFAIEQLRNALIYNVLGSLLDDINQHLRNHRVDLSTQVLLDLFL